MKREKLLSCLTGAALGFALAMAGIGCMVTAFGLKPVNMVAITAVCCIWALICAVCVTARRGVLVLAAGGALMIGYLLREGSFLLQIEAFLFNISGFYNAAYGWNRVFWSGLDLAQVPMDGALLLIGAVVILLAVLAVCIAVVAGAAVGQNVVYNSKGTSQLSGGSSSKNKSSDKIYNSNGKEVKVPEGIKLEVPSNTELFVRGADKQLVGEFAANVRKIRQPEPYKGKGIRYHDEHIIRKVGKKAA